ncbi:ABC transporter ATP-binding protein [Streptococcus dentasini]
MIQFDHVSKVYNDKTVVDDVTFTIEKGEFITILGSSGSGKTTTLKMINRLIEPSKGRVFFEGKDLLSLDPIAHRRHIGYVVQQIGLFPHLTVTDNVATVPKLLKWDKKRIAEETDRLLELVQLPSAEYGKRYPHELSGGQQQRVGVARALASNPNVILFDEPFGAIDAITRTDLQEQLVELHQQLGDKTFIFITHDITEAFKLGNRVLIMDQGKICQFASPKQIIREPQGDFVRKLVETARAQESLWSIAND